MDATQIASIAVFVAINVYALMSRRRARYDAASGRLILRHSRVLSWPFVLIGVAGFVGLGVVPFVRELATNGRLIYDPVGFAALFFLLTGIPYLAITGDQTHLDTHGLTSFSAFRRPVAILWTDVQEFSHPNRFDFRVHGRGRTTVLLTTFYVGARDSLPYLRAYLPADVLWEDADIVTEYARATGGSVGVPMARPVRPDRR